MPSPVLLWTVAIALAAIGRRQGGHRGRTRAAGAPRLVGLLRRLPMPAALLSAASGGSLTADAVTAGICDDHLDAIIRFRAAGAMGGCAIAVLLALGIHPAAGTLGGVIGVAAWTAPPAQVASKARRRTAHIVRTLPDLIDVVVFCTQAGMPLEPALRLAVKELPGPLADELETTLKAISLGTPRTKAYRGFSDRIPAPAVRGLIGSLVQADELGTPINDTLTRQASMLRAARRQAVRDQAARTAPKVQLVVAMVMVPGALLVVVGVMALNMIGRLGTLAGGLP